ncbi:MAG: hypothetical protein HXS42_13375 [Theionarchaea archaeon]|nr:hypothetical protein [Theionarchaea archaeon]
MSLSDYILLTQYLALVMIIMGILAFAGYKKTGKINKENCAVSLGNILIGCGMFVSITYNAIGGMILLGAGGILFVAGALPDAYRRFKVYRRLSE